MDDFPPSSTSLFAPSPRSRRASAKAPARRWGRELLAKCLTWCGIVDAARLLLWRDRVLVIVYHDPAPEVLDAHLTYLLSFAQPASLGDIYRPSIGRPRFVITIDDGHIGNRQLLDVFRAHRVTPVIFICSQIVGTRRQFWWLHSRGVSGRAEEIKRMANKDRLATLSALGFEQDGERATAAALSKDDIETMKGDIDFQSHGRLHPILTRCDDGDCETEIATSRQDIKEMVERDCQYFAYPNGTYGEREIALLKAAGYRGARTLDAGWNDRGTDPFRIKAVAVSDDSSVEWFAVQITQIPAYLRYLKRGSLFGRSPQF